MLCFHAWLLFSISNLQRLGEGTNATVKRIHLLYEVASPRSYKESTTCIKDPMGYACKMVLLHTLKNGGLVAMLAWHVQAATMDVFMDTPTACGKTYFAEDKDVFRVKPRGSVGVSNPPTSCPVYFESSHASSNYKFEIVVEAATFRDCGLSLRIFDGKNTESNYVRMLGCGSTTSTGNFYSKDQAIALMLTRTQNQYFFGSDFQLRIQLQSGIQAQYVGESGSSPCLKGFEKHGTSCYRYINMAASWMDAMTICRTMFSELVSIESQEENQFLTDLVKNETQADGAQSTDNLAERIWTSGANFQGDLTWTSTRARISYSSWHRGEPYVFTLRDVFCVMKMGDTWYSDQCKHERKFVCEKEIDGQVLPNIPIDSIQKPKATDQTPYTKVNGIQAVG